MFQYEFIRTAFIVGILLAITLPLIGNNIVFKRLSMTGDALSHTSLAGVAIGLISGFNPIIVAIIFSVVSALVIELIRKKFNKYSELSISIVLSAGIGIAALLSNRVPNANFNAYLFGNIFTVTPTELILTIVLFIIVTLFSLFFYKELMYIAYDEKNAKISGVSVNSINIIFTILTAVTVSIASRTIGALIVSSLMIVPVATSLQISKSYKSTIFISIIVSIIAMVLGIISSVYLEVSASGAIILIVLAILISFMIFNYIKKITRKTKKQKQ